MNRTIFSEEQWAFVARHASEDPTALMLYNKELSGEALREAVEQIVFRRQLAAKLPKWVACGTVYFPSRLSIEQCSSEATARYKARFAQGASVIDLTGGLGVDSYWLAKEAQHLTYCEARVDYCEAARHNYTSLGVVNVTVVEGDSVEWLAQHGSRFDLLYVDPARRGAGDKRLYSLEDCMPNVVEQAALMRSKADRLLIKVSPMADLKQLLAQVADVVEVHVVSFRNECKEVLLYVVPERGEASAASEPLICCVDLGADGAPLYDPFIFRFAEEQAAAVTSCEPRSYLYEPNVAILKGGAFRLLTTHFGVEALHAHSHLYTSDQLCEAFPGRRFVVEAVYPYNKRARNSLRTTYPKANIACRNFPHKPEVLRRELRIAEGGDVYLFATTAADDRRIVVACRKA